MNEITENIKQKWLQTSATAMMNLQAVKPSITKLNDFKHMEIKKSPTKHHNKTRPKSAGLHSACKVNSTNTYQRPVSAKSPNVCLHLLGVGLGNDQREEWQSDYNGLLSVSDTDYRKFDYMNDDMPHVPPSSPKNEAQECGESDFNDLSKQCMPRPQFHLQLPVVSDDLDDSDDCDTEKLLGLVWRSNGHQTRGDDDKPREKRDIGGMSNTEQLSASDGHVWAEPLTRIQVTDPTKDDIDIEVISDDIENLNISRENRGDNRYNEHNGHDVTDIKTVNMCDCCFDNESHASEYIHDLGHSHDLEHSRDCLTIDRPISVPDLNFYDCENNYDYYARPTMHAKGQITHEPLNLHRNGVHFMEERNKVFNITPRNRGRKIRSAPQWKNTVDRRFISDGDYELAMDICRSPMKCDENGNDSLCRSKHETRKFREKVDNLLRSFKHNSDRLPVNSNSNNKNDTDENNIARANDCKNTETSTTVKTTKSAPEKTRFPSDEKPIKALGATNAIVYDSKSLTQQSTKMCSSPEKNYYDVVRQSKTNTKQQICGTRRAMKEYSVHPASASKEGDILDCLKTQQLLNVTMRKIAMQSRPIVVQTNTKDVKEVPARSILRKTLSKSAPSRRPVKQTATGQPKPPTSAKPTPVKLTTSPVEDRSLDDLSIETCIEHVQNTKPRLETKKSTKMYRTNIARTKPKPQPSRTDASLNKTCTVKHVAKADQERERDSGRYMQTQFSDIMRAYAPFRKTLSAKPKRQSHSAPASPWRPVRSSRLLYLTSKPTQSLEVETEGTQECIKIHNHLGQRGIDLDMKTLKRALLPPDGTTTYFQLGDQLPRDHNSGLLSNPKTWLPEEYRRLQKYNDLLRKSEAQLKPRQMVKRSQTGMKYGIKKKRPVSASV